MEKISEILAGADILSTPIFVTFLHGGPVQMSRYGAGESPPVKAGQPAATPHLVTACGEHNIFKKEVWEKSAAMDFAFQNSKEILLLMPQHFVYAYILLTPTFCRRLHFVDAYILSRPTFC